MYRNLCKITAIFCRVLIFIKMYYKNVVLTYSHFAVFYFLKYVVLI